MPLLRPTYSFKQVIDININFLTSVRCQGLILDIDDTLAPQEIKIPENEILTWVNNLKNNNIRMVIASNNSEKRVSEFAKILEIPHIYQAKKPFRKGLEKAVKILSVPKENIFMVGDQIFSDILGANFTKINSILVEPLSPAKNLSLKIKRQLELRLRKKLQVVNFDSSNPEYVKI